MAVIKAQTIPKRTIPSEDMLARFCYLFPQYTYQMAREMPASRIFKMLKVAEKDRARMFYELTRIAAAPHSDKRKEVKKLLEYFRGIMED